MKPMKFYTQVLAYPLRHRQPHALTMMLLLPVARAANALGFFHEKCAGAPALREPGIILPPPIAPAAQRPRHIAHAAAAPLLYFMQLRYVLESVRLASRKDVLRPRVLAVLGLGLIVGSAGEAVGHIFGAGAAPVRLLGEEFHHPSRMTAADAREARNQRAALAALLARRGATAAT